MLDPSYNGHQVIATCRHEPFMQPTMQEDSDIEDRSFKSDLLEARRSWADIATGADELFRE